MTQTLLEDIIRTLDAKGCLTPFSLSSLIEATPWLNNGESIASR